MILDLGVAEVTPERGPVLTALDVPADEGGRPHLEALLEGAFAEFQAAARPVAALAELSGDEFADVYRASVANAPESVVDEVSPRADARTLFVVTLGAAISEAIARRFAAREYAEGAALDAVASAAADRAAEVVERHVEARLRAEGRLAPDGAALRYSPGYCGWHVSGQAALLGRLDAGRIGVRLTGAGFMTPEKSVSGVILAGPREIHRFSPSYPFCAECVTRGCLPRMRSLFGRRGRVPGGGAA